MAEEELDFEGDQMQVDEGSMLRTHSLVNTQLFEDVAEEKGTQVLVPRPRVANKMQAAFSEEFRQHWTRSRYNCWPTHKSVDRRGGDSSVSRGACVDEASCHFLQMNAPGTFWVSQSQEMIPVYKVKGPTKSWRYDDEDDENKQDNLQWKQNASRSWWKLEPEPKLKVEIPSQNCQMEQMLQIRREAQLLMDWTHPIRCIRLRAWVFAEALSRRPWQSSWFYEVQEAWKHPTSTIQVYIFWDKLFWFKFVVIYSNSLEGQHLKKLSTTSKWLMHVQIIDWRYRTMRRTKNDHERPRKT